MKSLKLTQIWLLLPIFMLSIEVPVVGDDAEKWQKDLGKDYSKILKAKSKKVERHRGLVSKWRKKGHITDLILLYEADIETERANAYLHYGLGYAYAVQDDEGGLEKAADQFKQAISLDSDMLLAHFSLGSIYQQQGKYDLALQEMGMCLQLNPKHSPAHYKRGEIYLKQDDFDEALNSFQTAMSLNQKWEYPPYGLGLVHFKQGNDDAAREAFEQAIDRNKKFAPARFKLGQIFAKAGFFQEALEEYKKAAKYKSYTAEILTELGMIFTEIGNQIDAINLYQQALAIDSAYSLAHLQLGEIYYATDQQELAIEHYQQAIEADPSLKDYFIEQLAPYHAGLMGVDEAKSLLDRTLAITPDNPQAHFYYAQIEADARNLTAAIQHYEKTIELIESDETYLEMELPLGRFLDAYMLLGDAYHQQNNTQKATATYRRAIELDPKLERHFFNQGRRAFDAEVFEQAIEPFSKFLSIYPEDVDATYLLGVSYEALADLDSALRLYLRTIDFDANHKEALMRSAQIYRGRTNPQNALKMLNRLIVIDPTNVEVHYLSGLSYFELVQSDDALDAFLETTRLDFNHVDAHYRAGLLYEQKGDTKSAINRYETTIGLDQSKADPFLRVGAIYFQRKDKDSVIRVYEPGLAIKPDHPQAQYDLAGIFEEREENEKAIKHFGLANQYGPDHFDWHFRYARLLDRHVATLEAHDQHASMAVNEYGKAIALKGDYAPAYFYRGLITRRYKQIGDVLYRNSQIAEDFKQVIELEPRNVDAHYYLGMTYVDLDQRQKAKETFHRILRLNRKYEGVNLQLGLILEREQKYKEAIEYYEAEITIDPKAARAYQHLGDLYNNYVLDFGRAQKALKTAIEFEPKHVPTLLNYGNTLFNLDQLGKATEQFEIVLQFEPENLTANYNLALMYEYTGKKRQAIDRWKRFIRLDPPAEWKGDAEKHLRQLQP